jgi:hypothetical protein
MLADGSQFGKRPRNGGGAGDRLRLSSGRRLWAVCRQHYAGAMQRAAAVARRAAAAIHPRLGRVPGRWVRGAFYALLVVLLARAGSSVVLGEYGDGGPLHLGQPRIVILKSKRELCLFDAERLVKTYPIALGSSPVGQKVCEGDGRTPEGRFHVATRNRDSKFHRFLGLSYPDVTAVERGLRLGLVSEGEATSIRDALATGRCPSWTSGLGGAIGIHGHGTATDWTAGCIALEDRHAEQLFDVMRIGDEVEILP